MTEEPLAKKLGLGSVKELKLALVNADDYTKFMNQGNAHSDNANQHLADQYKSTYDKAAGLTGFAASFAPGYGDGTDIVETLTGRDLRTGEALPMWQRGVTGAAMLVPIIGGSTVRSALNGLGEAVEGAVKHTDEAADVVSGALKSSDEVVAGAGKATKYFDDVQLKTEPNKSYFWSGMGDDGASTAANIARKNGGVTLETTIESQGIKMPKFDYSNPASVQSWRNASSTYAKQVSGEVRAVVGSGMRPNSIWNTIELPALKANPNVTKIITINPETLVETIIFTR